VVRRRLDVELVRRELARSRDQAAQLIRDGRVKIGGVVANKAATQVDAAAAVTVVSDHEDPGYVSRGAYKLRGALDDFEPLGLGVSGRRCLDAGASTGGFTDVLLRAGASEVVAVDVGYGQLAWSLRQDERVEVLERTNVRALSLAVVRTPVDLVVADLSVISLSLVLAALVGVMTTDGDLVVMVKPQFEVGKERLGEGGVVRDPLLRAAAVRKIGDRAVELGLGVRGVTASPLPGPAGNVEYFLWLSVGAPALGIADLEEAVAKGPA
jgi:23S rRNA (cytidine1920-2'-O)/16S rRNA (cytidine1409-2'-O)-methyltransferase